MIWTTSSVWQAAAHERRSSSPVKTGHRIYRLLVASFSDPNTDNILALADGVAVSGPSGLSEFQEVLADYFGRGSETPTNRYHPIPSPTGACHLGRAMGKGGALHPRSANLQPGCPACCDRHSGSLCKRGTATHVTCRSIPDKPDCYEHQADITTSRRRYPIPMAPRISGTPMRSSQRTHSPGSSGWTGYDTFFLTGSPTSTVSKCSRRHEKKGLEPRALADRNTGRFIEMGRALGCSHDDFIRTTEDRHYRSSQAIWSKDGGSRRHLQGSVCRLVLGPGRGLLRRGRNGSPRRRHVRYGPQGTPVEWVEEETYFFRLSAYQDRLLALYRGAAGIHRSRHERRNEVVSFVKSRPEGPVDLPHDVRLGHSACPGDEDHVMYVWVDALTNYITGVGYPDEERSRTGGSGRRICMSSARISSAFTPSTGRPF